MNHWTGHACGLIVAPHLRYDEVCCPCCGVGPMANALRDGWIHFRTVEYTKAILVPSCYRCPDHNAAIGGAPNSKHMLALAMDWAPEDVRDWRWFLSTDFIRAAVRSGFRGIGMGRSKNANSMTHVDTHPRDCQPGQVKLWEYENGLPVNFRTVAISSLGI